MSRRGLYTIAPRGRFLDLLVDRILDGTLLGGWDRSHVVEDMLTALSVLQVDKPVGEMSGGERRRAALWLRVTRFDAI